MHAPHRKIQQHRSVESRNEHVSGGRVRTHCQLPADEHQICTTTASQRGFHSGVSDTRGCSPNVAGGVREVV